MDPAVLAMKKYDSDQRVRDQTSIGLIQQNAFSRYVLAFNPKEVLENYRNGLTILNNAIPDIFDGENASLGMFIALLQNADTTLTNQKLQNILTNDIKQSWLEENSIAKINAYKGLLSLLYPGALEFLMGKKTGLNEEADRALKRIQEM